MLVGLHVVDELYGSFLGHRHLHDLSRGHPENPQRRIRLVPFQSRSVVKERRAVTPFSSSITSSSIIHMWESVTFGTWQQAAVSCLSCSHHCSVHETNFGTIYSCSTFMFPFHGSCFCLDQISDAEFCFHYDPQWDFCFGKYLFIYLVYFVQRYACVYSSPTSRHHNFCIIRVSFFFFFFMLSRYLVQS